MPAKKEKRKKRKGFLSFFRDERVRMVLGSFIILFSLYMALSFFSYFFTWKADQSFDWEHISSGLEIRAENWAGRAGAWLSNVFIHQWFGIPSLLVPFLLFIAGVRLFGIRLLPLRRTTLVSLAAMIILSVTLGYIFGEASGLLGSGPGGAHGHYLSEWLTTILGRTGALLLIIFTWFAFIVLSFYHSGKRLIQFITAIPTGSDTEKTAKEAISPADKEEETVTGTGTTGEEEPEKTEEKEEKKVPEELRFATRDLAEQEGEVKLTVEQLKEELQQSGEFTGQAREDFDPTLELPRYQYPPLELLEDHSTGNSEVSNEELISNKNRIVETLGNYKIQIDKIKATIGPTITLYEIVPAPGIRISKIKNLEDDIALSLAALGIRIIAPIPGRGTIGIEVPNQNPEIVSMRSIIASKKFRESKYDLAIGLGKTISNETYMFDLTRMPHLLIAGATGQGKSVGLNAIITSLLYRMHPAQLKFVMIDPKKVELTLYSKIEKHFLAKLPDSEEPIVNDVKHVIRTLQSLTIEMDQRYNLLKKAKVRNIKEYNQKFIARQLNPQKGHRYMPYIVMIVDEFADLIMTAGREIETPLARLAQLARAVGIHLIIATQRPSTNIITGAIKANFPARIAFKVTAMVDSRTILDTPGANQLVGRGDMLISHGSELTRLQCAFIDTSEIEAITDYVSEQQSFTSAFPLPEVKEEEESGFGDPDNGKRDELFEEAARLVVQHQQGSTSLIQRKFSIGYNRAGRIIDQLEAAGIVGPYEGSKARQVKFQDEYSLEQYLNGSQENKDGEN